MQLFMSVTRGIWLRSAIENLAAMLSQHGHKCAQIRLNYQYTRMIKIIKHGVE